MGKHRKKPNRVAPNYDVGYCRPANARKFKKGHSGNPRGRPRKRKTVSEQIDALMTEMVAVTINGRQRKMPRQEVGLRAIGNAYMKGDLKAAVFLFRVRDLYRDSDATVVNPAHISAQDRELLRDYMRRSDDNTGTSESAAEQDYDSGGSAAGTGHTEAGDD